MGYRVAQVVRQKGPQFKVLFEWFKDGVRRTRAIPRNEWHKFGFSEAMTLEDAQARRDMLNAQERLASTERKRKVIQARLSEERDEQTVFLNPHDVAEFEATRLEGRSAKVMSYWNMARRVLADVKLSPQEWEEEAEQFYKAFFKRKMSPAYVQKVLPILNLWGAWNARRYKQAFLPLPALPRHWRDKLYEQHYDKQGGAGNKESAPLPPELLASKAASLPPEQARWLAWSVWFGLRPVEVDLLRKPSSKKTWWVERAKDKPVLCIYQTKLKGLSPEKRTKRIPCNEPEQRELIKQLEQPVKRPLQKTMRDRFGEGITLYGGRKNFVKLMKERGHKFEHVSAWLGHTKLDRTYKDYFDRSEVVGA